MPDSSPLTWLTDIDSPEAPASLDQMIRAVHYEQLQNEKGEQAANSPQGQALVRANTVKQLGKLGDVADRAIILEAVEAERTGWHHFVPGNEYATTREMLSDLLGEEKSTSLISDITFLANVVVPFAENNQIKNVASLIGRDKSVTAKARAIVPRLRLTMASDLDQSLKTKAVQKCFDLVADKSVSEATIRADNPDSPKRIPKFEVTEYISKGDETLLVIKVSKRQRAFVKNQLGDKADWLLGDRWPRSVSDLLDS